MTLGNPDASASLDRQARALRKQVVFHVMYGSYPSLTDEQHTAWRRLCGQYIDFGGDLPPLTSQGFLSLPEGV